jgi:hypothetical protein
LSVFLAIDLYTLMIYKQKPPWDQTRGLNILCHYRVNTLNLAFVIAFFGFEFWKNKRKSAWSWQALSRKRVLEIGFCAYQDQTDYVVSIIQSDSETYKMPISRLIIQIFRFDSRPPQINYLDEFNRSNHYSFVFTSSTS